MNIVIPDDYGNLAASLNALTLLKEHQVTFYNDHNTDLVTLVKRFYSADALILIRERTVITRELIAQLPNLKVIVQTGRLSSNIDTKACQELGITVLDGTGSPIAPSELAWTLILLSRRKLLESIASMKNGQWQTTMGSQLSDSLLGIWGYGKIGQRLARYAQAFDMKVMVWGSQSSRDLAQQHGFLAATSKDAFFQECDVISLHLKLTDSTRHIVSEKELSLMKLDALIVNISRAELIKPNALLNAVTSGRPGYAAVDVYEQEPILDKGNPLLMHPNIICTPHMGYVEKNGMENYFTQAINSLLDFYRKESHD